MFKKFYVLLWNSSAGWGLCDKRGLIDGKFLIHRDPWIEFNPEPIQEWIAKLTWNRDFYTMLEVSMDE